MIFSFSYPHLLVSTGSFLTAFKLKVILSYLKNKQTNKQTNTAYVDLKSSPLFLSSQTSRCIRSVSFHTSHSHGSSLKSGYSANSYEVITHILTLPMLSNPQDTVHQDAFDPDSCSISPSGSFPSFGNSLSLASDTMLFSLPTLSLLLLSYFFSGSPSSVWTEEC